MSDLRLPDLVQLPTAFEARHPGLDGEQSDALGALLRTRSRGDQHEVGAEQPLVMKVFEPFKIQSSPSRTALVFNAARSEPPEGSVIASAVISSPVQNPGSQRCFCSSVHRSTRYGATQSVWMPTQEE